MNPLIEQINQQLVDCYEALCQVVLSDNSYSTKVEIASLNHYFKFLESSLTKPYNRIIHLTSFMRDEEGLVTDRMYPLMFMLPEVKAHIEAQHQKAEQLAACLDILGEEEGRKVLEIEPHERD